jgi:hypothetical protein
VASDRTFGVEIECGTPWDNRGYAEIDYDDPDFCCEECAYEDRDDRPTALTYELLRDNGFADWCEDIHSDGTMIEIPGPVLQGEAGLNELRRVLTFLSDRGFYVTSQDGLHVHHGADEFRNNPSLVSRLVESWAANQEHIDEFVDPLRRGNYWACESWHPDKLARFRENIANGVVGNFGRGNLNTDSIPYHGTIEIRQLEGTLDPDLAVAWVRFGQRFIERVVRDTAPLTCADSAGAFLGQLGLVDSASNVLLRKAGLIEEVAA